MTPTEFSYIFFLQKLFFQFLFILEDTARYAGILLAPAEGFGLRPGAFFALGGQKRAHYAVLANSWQCFVSSSNLGNF